MILRDKCSTSYDLASLFRGRRSTLDRWSEKSQNALVRGHQLCTQLSIFELSLAEFFRFWCCQLRKMRKSRRVASFLMLSTSKNEEVSQNCFVFDVVNFENNKEEVSPNCFVFDVVTFKHCGSLEELLRFWCCQIEKWGSLAELLRFWCCQLWKMKKSRRIASFSSSQRDR